MSVVCLHPSVWVSSMYGQCAVRVMYMGHGNAGLVPRSADMSRCLYLMFETSCAHTILFTTKSAIEFMPYV